jgi:hypothetical protein
MLACLDHSTVAPGTAGALRGGRPLPGPDGYPLDPESRRSRALADLYLLRIPESGATAAAWRRWRPGRIGVHPVFRILGGPAALTLEQLTGEPVRTFDLPALTGLSALAAGGADRPHSTTSPTTSVCPSSWPSSPPATGASGRSGAASS